MLHKAWNSKGEMPYCFPRSSIKFQGHTVLNITDFDPNWTYPDYKPDAAFKSLRFALFCWWWARWGFGFLLIYFHWCWNRHCIYACDQFDKIKLNWIELKDKTWILHNMMMMKFEIGNMITHRISKHIGNVYLPVTQFYWETLTFILRVNQSIIYVCHLVRGLFLYDMVSFWLRTKQATGQ